MVLAAGYGTRLRPLSNRIPKPLVPVAGRPMIAYALDHLKRHGIRRVVVNVSHLKDQLLTYLNTIDGMDISISEEIEPLETGGGLKKALPQLGDAPFFTVNSDIIWTDAGETALHRLERHWDDAHLDVLMLVQSQATAIGYDRGEDALFVKRENTREWDDARAPYIIAGVGILHPRALANAPSGKFSVKVIWQEAMRRGRLGCVPHLGRWFQTGSVADIARAEAALARAA